VAVRTSVISSVADVGRDAWEDVAGERSFYSSYEWVRYQERAAHATPAHVLVHDDERLVAAIPAFLVAGPDGGAYDPASLFDWPSGPLLLAGGRRGYRSAVLAAPGERQPAAVAALGRALLDLAAREGARAAALWLPPEDVDLIGPAQPGPAVDLEPEYEIDARGGLAGYLERLPAKRRREVRRERRRFAESRAEYRRVALEQDVDRFAELVHLNLVKWGGEFPLETLREMFRGQAQDLGARAVLHGVWEGDVLVGGCMAMHYGDRIWARASGFDEALLTAPAAYFELVLYRMVDWAEEVGASAVHLGVDAGAAKVSRGATPTMLSAVPLAP
jgi:predicted N-acyltransferase